MGEEKGKGGKAGRECVVSEWRLFCIVHTVFYFSFFLLEDLSKEEQERNRGAFRGSLGIYFIFRATNIAHTHTQKRKKKKNPRFLPARLSKYGQLGR